MKKRCNNCGSHFDCTESSFCWCFKIPPFIKIEKDDFDCFCKICLLKKYEEKLLGQNIIDEKK